ncbi:hypothetical protein ACSQ67_022276 [Phaseolus vulgaris]
MSTMQEQGLETVVKGSKCEECGNQAKKDCAYSSDLSNSGLEFKFPAVTSSMASFSCVQVRSMDDTVNETAYQTSVNIGGHVFSGFLYDQGPEQSFNAKGDNPFDQQHDLNLRSVSLHTRDGASATMPPLSLTASQEPFFIPHHSFPLASFRPDLTYLSHPKS